MEKDKEEKRESLLKRADATIQDAERHYLSNRKELSDEQKHEIAKMRAEYFCEEHLGNSKVLSQVEKALGSLGIEVYKSYLPHVKEAYRPVYDINGKFNPENRMAYFDITRWVRDKEEKNLDKLINVYQVLANEECNIALIYTRKHDTCKVSMAIVNTKNGDSKPETIQNYKKRVISALSGNFPGVEIIVDGEDATGTGIPYCLENVVHYKETENNKIELDSAASVAVVSNLATDKSEDFISQSMEKLLDGIVPEEGKEYTLLLLATPSKRVDDEKNRIYEIYKGLAPYATWQENFSMQDNTTLGTGSSLGKSVGADVGFHVDTHAGAPGTGISAGVNTGINFGANFGKSANFSIMAGKSTGETKTCTNYSVKHALELLEEQIKRLEECSALGMWEFAAYAISEDSVLANNVATMYLALTQGEKSYLSQAAINLWHGKKQREEAGCILESLRRLHHPHFVLDSLKCKENKNLALFRDEIDLYTIVSGKELARALNFPRKSVAGFTVIESASFGRTVQKFSVARRKEADMLPELIDNESSEITVGNIVHMYKEEDQEVKLDINSFTSHIFVTGSTGTGKSNTIYQLLSKAMDKGIKVMVIEPAKGEYKTALGALCHTYGTNPLISEVLRINPFSFPTGDGVEHPIHVLEHIDRLIEILNACWPMYAAMPAVLKDAVEQAYQNKGWDLYTSECYPLKFPTFDDLLETLPEVMENSMYSKDTKSDYVGALITRVNSLTNGINGLVFCSDNEVSASELFDENVIIDISRVGSNETKSMLMGILIMKLQEYHMSNSGMNEELKHITVLEEAHNLLRRISSSQNQDSANLQGKAVEMLANSIAEMRTYGEGFIIADQAPGLLDESVIRNTNTKIILRLPDAEDRKLVGKAAALIDEQTDELAKLPCGVATVYQNDWVEAVLCQFEKFNNQPGNSYKKKIIRTDRPSEIYFERLFGISDLKELSKEEVEITVNWINRLACPNQTKTILRRVLRGEKIDEADRKVIAYNLFEGKRMAKYLDASIDTNSSINDVDIKIRQRYNFENDMLITQIRQLILQYVSEHMKTGSFEKRYIDFMGKGKG